MTVKDKINRALIRWFIVVSSATSIAFVAPKLTAFQLPPFIDLKQGATDVTVLGAEDADKAGLEMTSGDFNGDNATDWVIFSGGASPLGRQGAGILHILWGGTMLDSTTDLASPLSPISKIIPAAGNAGLFSSLTSGDFNRDGYDDIALGVACNTTFSNCTGNVFIVFGRSPFPDTLDIDNIAQGVTTIIGALNEEFLGLASAVGDINGDTYTDLVVSAPASTPGWGGGIYIVYGRDSFPGTITLSSTQPSLTRIIDPAFGWGSGLALACGDVNKDNLCDILIGSPGDVAGRFHGKATIVYGTPSLPDTVLLVDNSPVAMTRIYSDDSQEGGLGTSVAFGDVNGDNWLDTILSAHGMHFPPTCFDCGEIYVVHGGNPLPDSVHVNALDIQITRIIGAGHFQNSGTEVIASDISGDQFDDIVISQWAGISPPDDVHKAIIVYGSATLPDSIFLADDSLVTRIYGEAPDDNFSLTLGADDLDGDGVLDLYIGAPFADVPLRDRTGKVYLFYGTSLPTGNRGESIPLFVLQQNYPNPFSSTTTISYELQTASPVTLSIYNVLGQRVAQVRTPFRAAGPQTFTWDGLDNNGRTLASGIYLYRLETGGLSQTRKMIILR